MAEAMNSLGFKFKIGDFVATRGTVTQQPHSLSWLSSALDGGTRYIVLERIAVENIGGVALHYLCGPFKITGSSGVNLEFHEIELEPSAAFEPQKKEAPQ